MQVRNFAGDVVYHPKVFLAHDANGKPKRFLVGSANLSRSAFTTSVEAGLLSADSTGLRTLHDWFNDLFDTRTAEFTPECLRRMEEAWRAAAAARARTRLRVPRRLNNEGIIVPVEPEDLDAIEDVFATIQLPIGLLNIDYARNNIRNIARARTVLGDWNNVRRRNTGTAAKQRSELKLLGFVDESSLTPLGRAAAAAASEAQVARLWCAWLQQTPDSELHDQQQSPRCETRVCAVLAVAARSAPTLLRERGEPGESPASANNRVVVQRHRCGAGAFARRLSNTHPVA